jgi:hypothetical protein
LQNVAIGYRAEATKPESRNNLSVPSGSGASCSQY